MGQEQNSDYYNWVYRSAPYYTGHFSFSRMFPVWAIILGSINQFNFSPKSRILDLGCGPGQFADFFSSIHPNFLYYGIDFSETALKIGRQKMPATHLIRANLAQIPVRLSSFNCFILSEILEHIQDDIPLMASLPPFKPIIASVPTFKNKAHVRIFESFAAITRRYSMLKFTDFGIVNHHLIFVGYKKEP